MTDRRAAAERADADPTDGRDESVNERMDRNWNEILQELRVTQTGTQIFTGFLLTIAFQQRFGDLTTFQTRVYLVLVVTAVLTTALGLAPVNLHRALFRRSAKKRSFRPHTSSCASPLRASPSCLIGTVLLIFDLVIGRTAALVMAGFTLARGDHHRGVTADRARQRVQARFTSQM